jgi:hypothetical protein
VILATVLTAVSGPEARANALLEKPVPPKTPKGFARCDNPVIPADELPRGLGEQLEYDVELLGLSLGTASIATWRRGRFGGKPVTEYRAWVEPDPLISAILALEARAYAIVQDGETTPIRSMTKWKFRGERVEENQIRAGNGTALTSTLQRNGKAKTASRRFPDPVHDFMSGFLLLRRWPERASGCTIVYGEHRAYTVWLEFGGTETLETPRGPRSFDRYEIRYVSDRSKTVKRVELWMTPGPDRIPFKAEADTDFSPVVRLKGYRPARDR